MAEKRSAKKAAGVKQAKSVAPKKTAGVKRSKSVATKKAVAAEAAAKKRAATKKAVAAKSGSGGGKTATSLSKSGKDPKGGLTAEGRRQFKEKEGLHLRPGVKGKADTPEKMVRKGSFLRRHFANPPGPVVDEKGRPTRQALQAAAWGEPVPKTIADERKLAAKGKDLLDRYHAAKGDTPRKAGAKRKAKKSGATG